MQVHLSETVNYVNNVNNYSVNIATVYDDWVGQVKLLEADIQYLTDEEVLNKLPYEFTETTEYIGNLWRPVKYALGNIGKVFQDLQDVQISDTENFYLSRFGIQNAKPFIQDSDNYETIADYWNEISDLTTNFRTAATQMTTRNEKAVVDLDNLTLKKERDFAVMAIIIGVIVSILLVIFVRILTGRITKRIMNVRDISGSLKKKDFTVDINPNGSSEMKDLMINMNQMIEELNAFLDTVKKTATKAKMSGASITDSANSTAAATTQIDANIESIRKEFDQISLSVEKSVSIISEMDRQVDNLVHYNERQTKSMDDAKQTVIEVAQTLKNISEMASSRSRDAKEMNTLVEDGDEKIKFSAKKLEEIKNQLKEIGGIVKIINEIASQTNLLSMNAAIESAHAGEAGKGFSVVAAEIRSLAENTGVNAKKIKEAINEIVDTVSDANVAGAQASEAFGKVRVNADHVVQSMEEISGDISKIDMQMQSIKEKTEETAQAANEISGYSAQLAEKQKNVIQEVESMNNRFTQAQNGIREIKNGTADIVNRVTEVSANSSDSYKNMEELESILSEFKTQKEELEIMEEAKSLSDQENGADDLESPSEEIVAVASEE